MYGSWALAALATLAVIVVFFFVPPPASWMATGIALPIVILFWLLPAIVLLYRRLGVEYTLTTQRFIHKSGVLRRVMNRISVIDIDDVSWEQGLIERMFGVGTIKLLSSDISDPKLILRGIADVSRVANMIDDARREERRKRALYMETV
jgi:membrane protein YdbS with pleckstrin-like domain